MGQPYRLEPGLLVPLKGERSGQPLTEGGMSQWRLAVRALHELGGRATASEIQRHVAADFEAGRGLVDAAARGLVSSPGRLGRDRSMVWHITPFGIDWCENRVEYVARRGKPGEKHRGGPNYWRATWVSSLPRGIRLGAGA